MGIEARLLGRSILRIAQTATGVRGNKPNGETTNVLKSYAKFSGIGFVYGFAIGQPYQPTVPIIAYLNIKASEG